MSKTYKDDNRVKRTKAAKRGHQTRRGRELGRRLTGK